VTQQRGDTLGLEDTLVEEDIHPVYVSEAATDTGRVRTANQDAFAQLGARGVWAVADGMGGYRDGDVASRMVCEGLQELDETTSLEATIDAIRRRMTEVNERLHQASIREHNPVVSGSTVAVFIVQRTACAVVWAGDSRIYRFRHGRLTQLTTDHTWAAELNLQQPNEEADHAITRAVGGEDTLLLDVRRDRVRLGDRYLLCSDGLTRELPDERIAELMAGEDVQQCAKALIDATMEAGARDNVTVVVVEAQ
jgi:serine/threonine protein phosphatase PrpC